jgi:hypothetical protein
MEHATQRPEAPVIAIYCRELKAGGDPFSSEYYWQAYQDLFFALRHKGVEVYFATDNNTYKGYGTFATVYTLEQGGTVGDLKPVSNVHVDVVFDRGGFIGRDVAMINPSIITKIAQSKIEMYEYFAELQPFSIVSHSKDEVAAVADELGGDKIVVKEPEGSGGNEVYIGTKEEVLEEMPDDHFPVLVQEFLDTSVGVPGQIKGPHDVRVALCGSEVISYYVRQPEDGKLHANVAQGGKMLYFDVDEVPAELTKVVRAIDDLFIEHPRYYSLDFMHTPKGWKLVEINSYLGLMPRSDGSQAVKTLEKLSSYLAAEAYRQAA